MVNAMFAVLETEEQRNELTKFYEKHKKRLYMIAFEHLHNKELAEDAIQEVFLRIADKPDKFFSLDEKPRIWFVSAVIRNISIDYFKKYSGENTEEITEDVVYIGDFSPLENSLFDKISRDEILCFIDNLPTLQRNVLKMTCLAGLSISETAQTLKVSTKVVNQRLYLARKAIREFIEERG